MNKTQERVRNTQDPARILLSGVEVPPAMRVAVGLLCEDDASDPEYTAWLNIAEEKVFERLKRHLLSAPSTDLSETDVKVKTGAGKKVRSG